MSGRPADTPADRVGRRRQNPARLQDCKTTEQPDFRNFMIFHRFPYFKNGANLRFQRPPPLVWQLAGRATLLPRLGINLSGKQRKGQMEKLLVLRVTLETEGSALLAEACRKIYDHVTHCSRGDQPSPLHARLRRSLHTPRSGVWTAGRPTRRPASQRRQNPARLQDCKTTERLDF